MPEEDQKSQFLIQIIEQTLKVLSESPAFDNETLRSLEELAKSSGLTDYQRVVESLSTREEN